MKDAIKVVLYQGITFGLQVIFMLLAARTLGPETQGQYAIFRTCTYLIETFMWLGLTSGVTYFIAKDFQRYHSAMIFSSMFYIFGGVLISLPLVTFVLPSFQIPIRTGMLLVCWVVTLASVQFFLKIFLGQCRYRLFNYINILIPCVLFLAFLAFWYRGHITLHSVIYCNVIANLAALVASLFAHRHYLRGMDVPVSSLRGLLAEFYSVGLKGYFSSVAFQALYRADFFFVGYFLGARTLGIYSLAVFVVEAIQKVPDWLGLVLVPKVSAGLDTDGHLTRKFAFGSCAFVLAIAVAVGVAHLTHFDYLVLALGPKYNGVEIIVLALMPKAILHGALAIYGGNLAGKGYTLYHPLAGCISLLTLVVLDAILFKYYHLTAAVIGITISYCIATAILIFGTRHHVERSMPVLETVDA